MKTKLSSGQSVIEVIVAVSLMVIIAGSSVIAVLGSMNASRLAKEETQATFLASLGLEATQSIRNQSWNNLVTSSHGLTNSTGTWTFSGSFDIDPSGKFTRTTSIFDVQRNSSGDIVYSGGVVDPNTKLAVSSVTWSFSPTRNLTVELTSLLTNWEQSVNSTPTPTPSPSPTPVPTSCLEVCQASSFITGTCRKNTIACSLHTETHTSTGDIFCTGGKNADTCCCGN